MHSGASHSCTEKRSQRARNGSGKVHQSSADLFVLSFLLWPPETIEWEDFVSVWLHQLDFNETARGVQVQAARWTDIEVLIRPGNQESLTWRLLVGLYCWGTVIAFPSISHMDGQRLAPPSPPTSLSLSPILKVSVELPPSFSAGWWDHRHLSFSWCSNTGRALRVRNHYERQGHLIISLETIAAMVNFSLFIFPAYICISLTN